MIKKLGAIILLALFMGVPAAAGDPDDADIFYKFILYTQKVYLTRALENLDQGDFSLTLIGKLHSARVLGYSLGNLLQYARRGSDNHNIWLMLERKTKEAMFDLIDRQGAQEGWDRAFIEKRKQNALAQFMGAQQGWFSPMLVAQTGVTEKEAPNFFETLVTVPPEPPPVEPPAPPPVNPPAPPVEQPIPPPSSPQDGISGTYRITGRSGDNDPPYDSLVTISGSMLEVETELKIWEPTKLVWHYKGFAKWDGDVSSATARILNGTTQSQLPPNLNLKYGYEIRIELRDGVWRPVWFNLGSHFDLMQLQSFGLKNQPKTLTIKNKTKFKLSAFLGEYQGNEQTWLGSVEPNFYNVFTNIPERGRWYVRIDPPPDTNLKSHSFSLYVKEKEYAYSIEVQLEYLR